jgi:hypothetical protein
MLILRATCQFCNRKSVASFTCLSHSLIVSFIYCCSVPLAFLTSINNKTGMSLSSVPVLFINDLWFKDLFAYSGDMDGASNRYT